MAFLRDRTTFTASTPIANLLAGSKFEFLARPSAVRVYATQTAVGDHTLALTVGNVVLADGLAPNVETTVGNLKRNEDLLAQGVGMAGDRIQLSATENSGAAGSILNWMVEIVDL